MGIHLLLNLLRSTKNIRLVQNALGHEDLSTTIIYIHIVDYEFENALKNLRKLNFNNPIYCTVRSMPPLSHRILA